MNSTTTKDKLQTKVLNGVALALGLGIFVFAWMRDNGFLPMVLASLGALLAIVNLLKLRKVVPKTGMSFLALIFSVAACSVFSMELSTQQEKVSTEEVKAVMPAELKDSVILQQEEESALDKLNSITDTTASNK